jgi:hypothetical protein
MINKCKKRKALLLFLVFTTSVYGQVWVIDDGEKIKRDATSLRFEQGIDNPVWAPGEPIRLFALRNETLAFQVVIEAEDSILTSVTVDLDTLFGPEGALIHNHSTDPSQFTGRYIERFVEHYFHIDRPSGGPWSNTLWWGSGDSGPTDGTWTGWMPDALIPVEVAPHWSPYPLQITNGQNGVVWIDITITSDQIPGLYTGKVIVKNNAALLDELDIELEIYDGMLPDWPLKTMYFYEYDELARRIGGQWDANVDAAEQHLWQLFHRHRITPFYTVLTDTDVDHLLEKLSGSIYTSGNGYEGPAEGRGDDLLSLGTYGGYGKPDTKDLADVEAIADRLAAENLFPTTDVFVYAIDEDCSSTYGQEWKDLLQTSDNQNVDNILIGWTCSEHPAYQPVDIVMMFASEYHPGKVKMAQDSGKKVWIYNGWQPRTGAFATDLDALSPRVNGWIQAYYNIERWFYWETTFWYDWNNGGLGPYDPFIESETFHNQYDEYGNGDGVLVYPGKQVDQFSEHSVGMEGVIASIRLKNIRRGIQDAGYYQLAAELNRDKADAFMRELVDPALTNALEGNAPAWGTSGASFYALRDSLARLIISGRPTGTGEKEFNGNIRPVSYEILDVHPNPFNPVTTISYELPVSSRIKLSVYNLQGLELQVLTDMKQPANNYQIQWDASAYPSGIYLLRMQTENHISLKKILLIK